MPPQKSGRKKLSMKDVLLWTEGEPAKAGPRRIGIHTSTFGGVQSAAERAYRLGANTFQIFSSSPRQWQPYSLTEAQCAEMRRLREKYDLVPMAIHTSYLVNLASVTPEFHRKSVEAFRGELQRALVLGAEFLVLHPGSFRGRSREEGLELVAVSIAEAAQGLDLKTSGWWVRIENTSEESTKDEAKDDLRKIDALKSLVVSERPKLCPRHRTLPVILPSRAKPVTSHRVLKRGGTPAGRQTPSSTPLSRPIPSARSFTFLRCFRIPRARCTWDMCATTPLATPLRAICG